MSRSVRISEAFHEFVKAHKREDETMEETPRRLIGGPRPEDVAGSPSSETAERMRERLRKRRETKSRASPTSGSGSSDPRYVVPDRPLRRSTECFREGTRPLRSANCPTHSLTGGHGALLRCRVRGRGGTEERRERAPDVSGRRTGRENRSPRRTIARTGRHGSGSESGIDRVDPMVAAVSDIYDESVLTANVEDFAALEVDVEAY